MGPKLIIFDFDGVLADSFRQLYALNKMAMAKVGVGLAEDQYRSFFMGNVHAGFKKFIDDRTLYEKFSAIRRRNFNKYYLTVKLFPGAAGLIKKLSKKYILAVVSSGEENLIEKLLSKARILKHFRYIYAGTGPSKEKEIKLVIELADIKPQEAVFISDTCGDIFLTKKLGLKTIGVGWGFHGADRLRLSKPKFFAKDFKKLSHYLLTH